MKSRLDKVYVNPQKICDYLLNVNHSDGGPKARLLIGYGFDVNAADVLEAAIVNHAVSNDINKRVTTVFGEKYLVEGPLETPSGKKLPIRSVWVKQDKEEIAKFVTLYPF